MAARSPASKRESARSGERIRVPWPPRGRRLSVRSSLLQSPPVKPPGSLSRHLGSSLTPWGGGDDRTNIRAPNAATSDVPRRAETPTRSRHAYSSSKFEGQALEEDRVQDAYEDRRRTRHHQASSPPGPEASGLQEARRLIHRHMSPVDEAGPQIEKRTAPWTTARSFSFRNLRCELVS